MASSPLQRRVAGVAILASVIAVVWMLTHRRPSAPSLAPPVFLEVTARGGATPRPLTDGAELTTSEALDFQLQVAGLSFVYVVKVIDGTPALAWGHHASDQAWEAGVYAPDWKGADVGMRFSSPGDVEVFAVASPLPVVDVAGWDVATLKSPGSRCHRCGVSSMHFRVVTAK